MSAPTVAEAPVAPVVPAIPSSPEPSITPATPELPVTRKWTLQEYFDLERTSEIRHEYVEGEIVSMPGESLVHNRIALNLSTSLDRAFEERDCAVYMEGIRLRVSPTKYRYPDVIALCGDPITDGENPPALLNPLLVVEVLSPSTEDIDLGEKFSEYRRMDTLTDYVMVAQDRVFVSHCVRQNARQWTLTDYMELESVLTFASLEVTLPLADIYRKVTFPISEPSSPVPASAEA